MNAVWNDFQRACIGIVLTFVGWCLEFLFWFRVLRFRSSQGSLRRELKLDALTPASRFGPEVQERLKNTFESLRRSGDEPVWAETSGSTREPKRLVYTRSRLKLSHLLFFDSYTRIFTRLKIQRRSFFIFASIRPDRSLTSLLLTEGRIPPRLVCLQTPYRVLAHPEVRELADRYGDTALRLWILSVSNPGMVYATNPSTLAAFLDGLNGDRERSLKLCKDWVERPEIFSRALHRIYRRIESRGAFGRVCELARSTHKSVKELLADGLPGLSVISSWDGGYVRPFLERVQANINARFVPLYSMSTETVETQAAVVGGRIHFLPIVPGVLMEFTSESSDQIILPSQLEIGSEYSLVVSDRYGLLRYQTDDLFECVGFVRGLPDLRFKRRAGLAYSFTGEKITGEQVSRAIEKLRATLGREGPSFSLFPRVAEIPHYELISTGPANSGIFDPTLCAQLLSVFESELFAQNLEFKAKRESGRLGPTTLRAVSIEEFAAQVSKKSEVGGWESQFKFLPLYTREFSGRVL